MSQGPACLVHTMRSWRRTSASTGSSISMSSSTASGERSLGDTTHAVA